VSKLSSAILADFDMQRCNVPALSVRIDLLGFFWGFLFGIGFVRLRGESLWIRKSAFFLKLLLYFLDDSNIQSDQQQSSK
jgi:hypothetical protein